MLAKDHSVQIVKLDSAMVKEILSDIQSSQNRHHKKLITYCFVLPTNELRLCRICPFSAGVLDFASRACKNEATDTGFKTDCALVGGKKKKVKHTK